MRSRLIPMLVTGFALALGLLIAVQIVASFQENDQGVSSEVTQQADLNKTVLPVIFKDISNQDGVLRLSGTAEAYSVVTVLGNGTEIGQANTDKNGTWAVDVTVTGTAPVAIDLISVIDDGVRLRSDETLYHIPAPELEPDGERLTQPPALIVITAPGGPSRIIQSPFRGLPTDGGLSLGPIDYDDSGSVIFSGVAAQNGTVRIFAVDRMIGEAGVAPDGRWFFIAAETLPVGEYDIRTELVDAGEVVAEVKVPFERIRLGSTDAYEAPVDVQFEPFRWRITRKLYGGGRQHTTIFAPEEAEPLVTVNP